MRRRVVITGTGMISPLAIGSAASFDKALAGISGIVPIDLFDASEHASQIAGQAAGYNPNDFFDPKEQRRTTRFMQFALIAAREAIKDSGLDMNKEDPYRVGTLVGNGIGSLQIVEEQYDILKAKGPRRVSPFLVSGMITNEAAGIVAMEAGAKGVNICTVTACASGGHAIGEAFRSIERGTIDVALTGGTEAAITSLGVAGFCALKALSTRNDDPQKASRPFSSTRDGFVMGEGAGILVLEELEHARKRGANIIAEIVGYGATGDAYHITAPDPEGSAGAKALMLAMEDAGINPDQVGYINAHGTSTPLNDKIETLVIKKALGEHAYKVSVSSTKSVTGHLLGAAGAIECIFSAFAIRQGVIPPTINLDDPDPECDLDNTPHQARERELDVALSNSLGFGGHNVCLAIRKFKG
jgi:3-oxoacyl-[acyl-carrier-protein] synthase II